MTIIPQCFDCKRLFLGSGKMACEAFPDDIPDEILLNDHDHKEPFPGDGGLLFVVRTDPKPISPKTKKQN